MIDELLSRQQGRNAYYGWHWGSVYKSFYSIQFQSEIFEAMTSLNEFPTYRMDCKGIFFVHNSSNFPFDPSTIIWKLTSSDKKNA